MKKSSEIEARLIAGGASRALAKSFAAEQVAEGLAEDDSVADDITAEPEFQVALRALQKAKGASDSDDDGDGDESYTYDEGDEGDDDDDDGDGDDAPGQSADFTPGRRAKSNGDQNDVTMQLDATGQRVVGVLAKGADKIVKSFGKTTKGLAVAGIVQVNALRRLQKSLVTIQENQEAILHAMRIPLPSRALTGTVTAQEHPGVAAEKQRIEKAKANGNNGEPLVHKLTAAIRAEHVKIQKSGGDATRLHQLAMISSQLDSGMNDDDSVRQMASAAGITL